MSKNTLLVFAGMLVVLIAFTLYLAREKMNHVVVNGSYKGGAIQSPVHKSLYEEINESPNRKIIEDIRNIDDTLDNGLGDFEKVDVPVSFYNMDPMEFHVPHIRAAYFRSSPRCELPTGRPGSR